MAIMLGLVRGCQFQAQDATYDQKQAGDAEKGDRFVQQKDADEDRAHRSDARPNGVGSAQGNGTQRDAEQHQAEGQHHQGGHRRPEPREALRVLESDGPTYLEESGEKQNDPSHNAPLRRGQGRPYRKETQREVVHTLTVRVF